VSSRPFLVNAAFAAVFVVIGILALGTAVGTTGPWFSATLSASAYSVSLIGAIVVAAALGSIAATQIARLEDARRSIDLRISGLPEAIHLPKGLEARLTPEAIRTIPPSDEEVDELLTTLATPTPGAPLEAEIELTGTLVEVSAALAAARTRKELLKALLVERTRVEAARVGVWPSVAGPIAIALLFAFAASAMLPGSEGFAATHYQLNTGLVLFLGYGWAFLGLWTVMAFVLLSSRVQAEECKPIPVGQ